MTAFGANKATSDGIHTRCKECVASAYRKRVERNQAQAATLPPTLEKRCVGCSDVKPASEFHRDRGWPDGLQRVCKACAKVRCAESYQRHRDQRLEAEAARRATAPEKDRAKKQRWAEANRDRAREQKRAYRSRMGQGLRAYYVKYREENLEAVRAYGRNWNRKNKDKVLENSHRRRARLRGAIVSQVDVEAVYERDGWICQLCGKPVDPSLGNRHPMMRSPDHIVPLSKGGAHEPANVQLAHLVCNLKKNNRT